MPAYNIYTDEELVARLRQGDQKAFSQIYKRYWEKLFGISWHYCRQKHISEEIVQDIFMSLWDRRASVMIESLPGYLATAAKFSILAFLKKELTHRQLAQQQQPTLSVSAEAPIHARFLKNYLHDRIKALPEQCRIVFNYSREEHLTVPEIAERMQLSPKTVENHLGRALRTLRGNLKEAWLLLLYILQGLYS